MKPPITSASVVSRGASRRKTSRPTSLPSRTAKTCTAARASRRARPSTSTCVRAYAAIFWDSIVRSIDRSLSRSTAAFSYSSPSEAASISRRTWRATASCRPSRNSSTWAMSARYASRATASMQGPWQRLMWYSRHGRGSARSPSLISIVQVRKRKSRRMRSIASSTLLAEAYGPK